MERAEFKKRDVIVKIGSDEMYAVAGVVPRGFSYYELHKVDKDGRDLHGFLTTGRLAVERDFVRVGRRPAKLLTMAIDFVKDIWSCLENGKV